MFSINYRKLLISWLGARFEWLTSLVFDWVGDPCTWQQLALFFPTARIEPRACLYWGTLLLFASSVQFSSLRDLLLLRLFPSFSHALFGTSSPPPLRSDWYPEKTTRFYDAVTVTVHGTDDPVINKRFRRPVERETGTINNSGGWHRLVQNIQLQKKKLI